MPLAALLLLAAADRPAAIVDRREFARGLAAVDASPSDTIALRGERAPSPSFRLGAAYRAWRNARAAITHDAAHPTGDGGDVEVLAEDCSDERIVFTSLETERNALGVAIEQVVAADPKRGEDALAAWNARLAARPPQCRQ
ncbi:hypothetical protein [Sphingomonas bacterium]|uniref:hypothetical protein n=1 Tax=Sphingomonas bacterium TaxID=1895847 RepID=UPI0015767507|nr:hypothetical protein [Sphingomonas bacterium]